MRRLVKPSLAALATALVVQSNVPEAGANPLEQIIAADPALADVAGDARYEAEVRYTQIDRDAEGAPRFTTYEHRSGDARYFYPASSVKFPAALVAVEKLRAFDIEGLDLDTTMLTGAAYPWQTEAKSDPTSRTGFPSLGHYLRKIFLVSDNDAYNRVFEFAGADALNKGVAAKGYPGVRLTYRLSVGSEPWHGRHSNPVRFVDGDRTLLELPTRESADFAAPEPIPLGVGEIRQGKLVEGPKDFRAQNAFPLAAGQEMLKALVFPGAVPAESRFAITAADREFILRAMGEWPSESRWPKLDPEKYYDAYVKLLVLGAEPAAPPERLRIFNKTGTAYGFLSDNAYVVDFENRVEFLLAAKIYVNANGIFNDNVYEYDTVGHPFMRDLGRAVLEYERERARAYAPDLTEFNFWREE